MSAKHTPEPWKSEDCIHPEIVITADGYGLIARSIYPGNEGRANARRIVAAVNACTGISTESLESGAVAEMQAALEGIHEWCRTDDAARALPFEPAWYQSLRAILAKLNPAEGHSLPSGIDAAHKAIEGAIGSREYWDDLSRALEGRSHG